ncbi:hypothetical protein AHAS_Ahas01G0179200 [Arachis hypogaea]
MARRRSGVPHPAFKWHAQFPFWLIGDDGVPCLTLKWHTQWHAHSFVGFLSLACHAWLLKWHAQVTFEAGVPRIRYQVACLGDDPFWSDELACHVHGSSGTPMVSDGLGVPCPAWCATPL